MTDRGIGSLLSNDVLDAELAALVWLLAEGDVPLTVVSNDSAAARELRQAIAGLLPAERRAADVAIGGGSVIGSSLEDVLQLFGAGHELSDETRDLGLVIVIKDDRVDVAHYVRPVERDAAGHLQRRPPTVLSARDWGSGRLDHFYWAFTDELATRIAMTRDEFEREHASRSERLGSPATH